MLVPGHLRTIGTAILAPSGPGLAQRLDDWRARPTEPVPEVPKDEG